MFDASPAALAQGDTMASAEESGDISVRVGMVGICPRRGGTPSTRLESRGWRSMTPNMGMRLPRLLRYPHEHTT
jgi:hypothetical protein